MKIYIEESGDLGFSEKSSEFFVIGAVIAENDVCPARCFKKARESLGKKKRDAPELKSYNTDITTKRRIFQCLAKCEIEYGYALLRKYQVYPDLRNEQTKIYNWLIGNLILKILEQYDISEDVHLIIDKSHYDFSREHFNEYLTDKMLFNGYQSMIEHDSLRIEHVDSQRSNGVQVADFFAGCVFRMFRDNDNTLYASYFEERTTIKLDYYNLKRK